MQTFSTFCLLITVHCYIVFLFWCVQRRAGNTHCCWLSRSPARATSCGSLRTRNSVRVRPPTGLRSPLRIGVCSCMIPFSMLRLVSTPFNNSTLTCDIFSYIVLIKYSYMSITRQHYSIFLCKFSSIIVPGPAQQLSVSAVNQTTVRVRWLPPVVEPAQWLPLIIRYVV